MAKQQKPGSGGVEEKKSLIETINANPELDATEKANFLAEANGLQTGNGGPADIIGQQTRYGINEFTKKYNEFAQTRNRLLSERRAKLQAQLEIMQEAPGAKQTNALGTVSQGGLLPTDNPATPVNLTALAQPVVPNLTGNK